MNRPSLWLENTVYWDAFFILDEMRPDSFGGGLKAITATQMASHCFMAGIIDHETFYRIMIKLDRQYRDLVKEKQQSEKDEGKNG